MQLLVDQKERMIPEKTKQKIIVGKGVFTVGRRCVPKQHLNQIFGIQLKSFNQAKENE
jgi:hypothetical protein